MNGNNSWQRLSPFASFPKHNLGPIAQRQALSSKKLIPMGQLMEGGEAPFQEAMPARQQDYGGSRDQPTGKKIMGMPKDRFIALMGSIAQAFGGDSVSGRMGANLINMADIMHGERMAQGEQQAAEAEAGREAAAELAKERRGIATTIAKEKRGVTATIAKEGRGTAATIAKEKRKTAAMVAKEKRAAEREIPSGWEATYKSMWGKIDPDTKRPYTIEKIRTVYEKTETKPPTRTEQRAQRKEIRDLEGVIWGITKDGTPNIEYPESQGAVDDFNEVSDESYVVRRVPEQEIDWGRDIPATAEKVPVSQFKTPEDIKNADYLSRKAKRRLLLKLFPKQFE